MKKVLLAASLFIAASSFAGYNHLNGITTATTVQSGDGTHIPASEVPRPVKVSFRNMFPTATNVRWELEREHGQTVYQADFLLDGKRWRAVFSADGTFIKGGAR